MKEHGALDVQNRHHVHLSSDSETALKVGMRYGKPIVLKIKSGKMNEDGIEFYLSENGVWLTENVDTKYIIFQE
jgi:putative RNA 2'-phosphotransferase